jgi:hypothetical protein
MLSQYLYYYSASSRSISRVAVFSFWVFGVSFASVFLVHWIGLFESLYF